MRHPQECLTLMFYIFYAVILFILLSGWYDTFCVVLIFASVILADLQFSALIFFLPSFPPYWFHTWLFTVTLICHSMYFWSKLHSLRFISTH